MSLGRVLPLAGLWALRRVVLLHSHTFRLNLGSVLFFFGGVLLLLLGHLRWTLEVGVLLGDLVEEAEAVVRAVRAVRPDAFAVAQ